MELRRVNMPANENTVQSLDTMHDNAYQHDIGPLLEDYVSHSLSFLSTAEADYYSTALHTMLKDRSTRKQFRFLPPVCYTKGHIGDMTFGQLVNFKVHTAATFSLQSSTLSQLGVPSLILLMKSARFFEMLDVTRRGQQGAFLVANSAAATMLYVVNQLERRSLVRYLESRQTWEMFHVFLEWMGRAQQTAQHISGLELLSFKFSEHLLQMKQSVVRLHNPLLLSFICNHCDFDLQQGCFVIGDMQWLFPYLLEAYYTSWGHLPAIVSPAMLMSVYKLSLRLRSFGLESAALQRLGEIEDVDHLPRISEDCRACPDLAEVLAQDVTSLLLRHLHSMGMPLIPDPVTTRLSGIQFCAAAIEAVILPPSTDVSEDDSVSLVLCDTVDSIDTVQSSADSGATSSNGIASTATSSEGISSTAAESSSGTEQISSRKMDPGSVTQGIGTPFAAGNVDPFAPVVYPESITAASTPPIRSDMDLLDDSWMLKSQLPACIRQLRGAKSCSQLHHQQAGALMVPDASVDALDHQTLIPSWDCFDHCAVPANAHNLEHAGSLPGAWYDSWVAAAPLSKQCSDQWSQQVIQKLHRRNSHGVICNGFEPQRAARIMPMRGSKVA